ncbi:MAG: polyphosphate kinase, partial [bacterium]|nr:polyphosphate kinase [bacterium]
MTIDLAHYESGAKFTGDYDATLTALQERLAKIQVAHIIHKRRSVILLEGWDAAGKGGIIQRMTADWDPRSEQVHP